MSASETLALCQSVGITLNVVDNDLRCEAPVGILTDSMKSKLRSEKAAIIALLTSVNSRDEPAAVAGQPQAFATFRLPDDESPLVAEYPDELATLGEWFARNRASLPNASYRLRAGHRVSDPRKFHASLDGDISRGPMGLRARAGALENDLADLRQVAESMTVENQRVCQ